MSNPQETSLAWLAGILDGEGWIGFNARQRHKTGRGKPKLHLLPWVAVGSTSYEIIKRCEEVCRNSGIKSNITKANRKTAADNTVWQWCIAGSIRAEKLLPLVLPYLVLKGKRAQAVLDFISSRKRTGYTKTYTQEELAYVAATKAPQRLHAKLPQIEG